MESKEALILIPEDAERGGFSSPFFLQNVLFEPALAWSCSQLKKAGIERLLIVCPSEFLKQAETCLKKIDGSYVCTPDEASEGFNRQFAGTKDEKLFVMTRPVLFMGKKEGKENKESSSEEFRYLDAGPIGKALNSGRSIFDAVTDSGKRADCEFLALPLSTAAEFSEAQIKAKRFINEGHIKNGVFFIDPENAYIGPDVKIGAGTTVFPGTIIKGKTVIGENCEIGPNTMIDNCTIGEGTSVNASQAVDSNIGRNVKIGPFAYIRPDCLIGDEVKIGDFVEVKNTKVGEKTKIPHLTYVGDSEIGRESNLGCGTITVNYDGNSKHKTIVGDNAFIGCNTNLVAPVKVGDGAYIAAGSTITNDVPERSLAIARARQTVKTDWTLKTKNKKD